MKIYGSVINTSAVKCKYFGKSYCQPWPSIQNGAQVQGNGPLTAEVMRELGALIRP